MSKDDDYWTDPKVLANKQFQETRIETKTDGIGLWIALGVMGLLWGSHVVPKLVKR